MDERITRRAARQHGRVARRQLLADGVPEDAVDGAVHDGRLHRVARGVYGVPGAPDTPAAELVTAVLRCGPDAFVVGERVLSMLGVREAADDGPFTVLVRPGRRLSNVPWPWRTRTESWPGIRAVVHDVPSTTVTWNLLEAAVDVEDGVLDRLADGVRWLGRGPVASVRRALRAHGTHPGAARLRARGLFEVGAAESQPERVLLPALAHHGAIGQVEALPGIRVDVLLPAARVVVEYDGFATHSGPRAEAADQERRRRLEAAGFVVVVVRAADLRDLAALVAQIDALVALRTRR